MEGVGGGGKGRNVVDAVLTYEDLCPPTHKELERGLGGILELTSRFR